MHKAPLDERLDFYRYGSAAQFFNQAKHSLKRIKEIGLSGDQNSDLHSYWDAFFISYSKPFKQVRDKELKRGLRLHDDIIPTDFLDSHNAIISLRDKMFAHTDFLGFKDEYADPLNAFIVHVSGRKLEFGVATVHPTEKEIERWTILVDELIKTTVYRSMKIWNRWKKHLFLRDDTLWRVNASPDVDDVLVDHKIG